MNKRDQLSARKALIGMILLAMLTGLSHASAPDAQADAILAIKGATVMPVSGKPVDSAVVLIRNGKIDFCGERMKRVYVRIKEMSRYFQKGYMGSNYESALRLFYQQRSADKP